MKLSHWLNEVRLWRMKHGLGPYEVAPLGQIWCPFGTDQTSKGALQMILQRTLFFQKSSFFSFCMARWKKGIFSGADAGSGRLARKIRQSGQ